MDDDTLILWEEDNILPEYAATENDLEKNVGICEDPSTSSINVLLNLLRSDRFPSNLKTIFWRLVCLMIFKTEGKICKSDFIYLAKDILSDFTKDSKMIDQLAVKSVNLLEKLEAYNPLVDGLKSYSARGYNDTKDRLRALTEEQKLHFQSAIIHGIFQYPPLKTEEFLKYCDFGLSDRLKLVLLSVIAERGFKEFSSAVEREIQSIRRVEVVENPHTAYDCLKGCVLDNVLYLTRYTYGALYNKLYNIDIKMFVDKLE